MTDAFNYAIEKGINSEADYPYLGKDGMCKYISYKAYKVNNGYVNVTANSTVALKTAIVNGPVSVAVQANQLIFQFYKIGVLKSGCGAKLNHGVLAVGYEMVKDQEAFIVKNSWGDVWGKKGYVHISTDGSANGGAGACGILKDASYPTLH